MKEQQESKEEREEAVAVPTEEKKEAPKTWKEKGKMLFPFLNLRTVTIAWILSILGNIALYIVVSMLFTDRVDSIIVHYSVSTATIVDGPTSSLFRLPVIGSLLIITNTILASIIYKQKRVIAIAFIAASLIIQAYLLLALIAIEQINA